MVGGRTWEVGLGEPGRVDPSPTEPSYDRWKGPEGDTKEHQYSRFRHRNPWGGSGEVVVETTKTPGKLRKRRRQTAR